MNQSTVVKTVSGASTRTTTTTRTIKSSTQQQQQQQLQTQQKVITKPPQMGAIKETKNLVEEKSKKETGKENHISVPRSEDVCVRCNRTVYKLEEVVAADQVWHKNCFRCKECDKPLNRYKKVDSYEIYEGVAYCKFHFKQLFGSKAEKGANDAQKTKPELIIRENQPVELPDGVVRSSDKYDLGLEDIQTAAVKKRFQMFEKISTTKEAREELQPQRGIKRGATVLSKMKKFHAKGMDVGVTAEDLKKNVDKNDLEEDLDDDDSIHSEDYDDETDVDLIRAKLAQRERTLIFDNMADIKNKFETGMEQRREERHKERKQEIQNIRSKLFMGKQARTKEMYENALVELETTTKLRNKGFSTAHELDNVKAAAENARNIKQKFETGDVYRKSNPTSQEMLDIDLAKEQKGNVSKDSVSFQISNKVSERMQMLAKQQRVQVKNVESADISNQFEFFENYDPEEHKRKEFKENDVKQQTSAVDDENEKVQNGIKIDGLKIDGLKIDGLKMGGVVKKAQNTYIERVEKSKTSKKNQGTEKVIDKDNAKKNQTATQNQPNPAELKSLKPSTPLLEEESSEYESEISSRKPGYLDSDLERARQAARTRDLKDIFEKWNYENNVYDVAVYNDSIPEYDEIGDSQTDCAKTIRAKFEQLPHSNRIQRTNQSKVNRFV